MAKMALLSFIEIDILFGGVLKIPGAEGIDGKYKSINFLGVEVDGGLELLHINIHWTSLEGVKKKTKLHVPIKKYWLPEDMLAKQMAAEAEQVKDKQPKRWRRKKR